MLKIQYVTYTRAFGIVGILQHHDILFGEFTSRGQIDVVLGLDVQFVIRLVRVDVRLVAVTDGDHLGPVREGFVENGTLPSAVGFVSVHVQRYQVATFHGMARDGIGGVLRQVREYGGVFEDDAVGGADGSRVGRESEGAAVEGEGFGGG